MGQNVGMMADHLPFAVFLAEGAGGANRDLDVLTVRVFVGSDLMIDHHRNIAVDDVVDVLGLYGAPELHRRLPFPILGYVFPAHQEGAGGAQVSYVIGMGPGFLHGAQPLTPVHELRIVRGIEVAPLGLQDWLIEGQDPYSIEVVSTPAFGLLIGELYHPSTEFWEIGADTIRIKVVPTVGPPAHHDLLLVAMTPQKIGHMIESFQHGWPADWVVEGNPSLVNWIASGPLGTSLNAFLPSSNEFVGAGPIAHRLGNNGYHAQGGSGTYIADPPDRVDDGHVSIPSAGTGSSEEPADVFVQLMLRDGVYKMRAATECEPRCINSQTPWREIPAEIPIRYEVWAGPLVFHQESGRISSALRLSLDLPEPYEDSTDWLESNFKPSMPWGAIMPMRKR